MGYLGVSTPMDIRQRKIVCVISTLVIGLLIAGCGEPVQTGKELTVQTDLGPTIGSLAEVFSVDVIPVEGYALVGGLKGTGSAECPLQIRAYLEKYILKQLPEYKDVERLIRSHNTAVVLVQGMMPAAVSKNQQFDVMITALEGAQTTSLENGQLWGAELWEAGKFGLSTRVLATAKGPVFTDTISASKTNEKVGYVLAGGRVLDEYKIRLALRQPDYKIASLIRNRLNERFEYDTAKAVSAEQIVLKVPAKYKEEKQRFISIIKATYLTETEEITKNRINTFIRKLAVSEDKEAGEIALEATGNKSLHKLAVLLNSSNEEVRLRAARCMLRLDSDLGLGTIREIAMDKDSAYRLEALQAIARAAKRSDATEILRRLLQDEDFDIGLAAYENLRELDDIAIRQSFIGRNFYLEEVAHTKHKGIFVSRSGVPRIVLFGSPIYCRDNIFVQSADGDITINAMAGQEYVSIIRKHPTRPNVIIPLKGSFELGDIIRTLCEEPVVKEGSELRPGLGVSYAETIGLLKRMCDAGAVEADFRGGPLPKIGLIVKK